MKNSACAAAVIAAGVALMSGPALAEDTPAGASPVPETPVAPAPLFKRISAPTGAVKGRISVQIDPEKDWYKTRPDPVPERSDTPLLPADPEAPGTYAIFWQAISPSLSDARPGRLEAALAALTHVPGLKGPRLEDMRGITDAYGRDILQMTVGTRVSPALVAAIISVESSGRVDAVSSAGATGLMQLMPATAERFGVTDRTEAAESIRGGVAYLDWLAEHFDHDPLMILAGYNAGEGAVRKHQGVPPYAETRDYVPKVLAAWKVASGLCRTPPQLLSDGCVFVGPSS